MAFGTGFAAVQESIKKASERGSSGKYRHAIEALWNPSWEDGETKLVRFLSNNVVTFPMHTFVPTKDGGHKDFACTSQLEGDLQRPCFICDNMTRVITDQKTGAKKTVPSKPTTKIFGVFVEKTIDDEGNAVDVTRELDLLSDPNKPDGPTKKVTVPQICIWSQGTKFWDRMNGFYLKYKRTTVDRDYDIVRKGVGMLTEYQPLPNDKDTEINTAEQLWEFYGIPVDGDKDPIQEAIIKWIERKGTREYFDHNLNTGNSSSSNDVSDEDPENLEANDEPNISAPTGTNFSSFKDRVLKDYSGRS